MKRKHPGLAALLLLGDISAALAQSDPNTNTINLPSAQQLVIMSIPDRLALFSSMQTLPSNQRDANLRMLKAEINGMTPAQKQQMQQHFHTEFDAMTPAQQSEVMQKLNDVQPPAPAK